MINKKNITYISIILFLICSIPYFFRNFDSGLDASWVIAINWIITHGYKFGEDIVFNYGPLGFLTAILSYKLNLIVGLIFWGILWIIQGYILIRIVKTIDISNKLLIFSLIVYIFSQKNSAEYYYIYLVLLSIAYLWRCNCNDRWILYLLDFMIAISIFIKFSLALSSMTSYMMFFILMLIRNKKINLKLVGHILFIFLISISMYLVYNPSLVEFSKYIKMSFEISSGYNMAMTCNNNDIFIIWVLIIVVLYLGLIAINTIYKNINSVFFLILFSPALFLMYKHGFVRADLHINTSFAGVLMVASIIILLFDYDSIKQEKIRVRNSLFYISIFILLIPTLILEITPNTIISQIKYKTVSLPINFYNYLNNKDDNLLHISDEFKNIIANDTVTIYPYEISYVVADDLNYIPMPLLQAYNAYTPILDNFNSQLFNKDTAPKYIIFNLDTIDQRIPLIEAPKTWENIHNNYSIVSYDSTNNLYLLEKNVTTNTVMKTSVEREFSISDSISIPKDYNKIYINTEMSLLGKLTKIFWKIPEINAEITYEDGTVKTGRVILDNLTNGISIDSLPYDSTTLMDNLNDSSYLARVKNIRFFGSGLKFYKSDITINFVNEEENRYINNISTSLDSIYSNSIEINLSNFEDTPDNFQYSIDKIYIDKYIDIVGWAFNKNNNLPVEIYIQVKDKFYSSDKVNRQDVLEYYSIVGSSLVGFESRIKNIKNSDDIYLVFVDENEKTYTKIPIYDLNN